MAANRKLQGEIDRTLKKVQEGVEIFDEIWEKVYGAQNQNQKEKFESELKSQIKKLQRYRDDIKTWITNSDIKDKRPLTDARKLIETEMERFKVCEKEFKTKAFSKEGLSQAPKEDPKEKENNRVRKWIRQALETFSSRVDVYEAELETINSAKKKKGKDNGAGKWEDLLERCRYHEERLEMILRLIDNESLSADDVDNIKDGLDYLLEMLVDGDYDSAEGIEDDSIYEELGLDELGGNTDDSPPERMASVQEAPQNKKEEKEAPGSDKKSKSSDQEEKKEKKKEKVQAAVTELPSINAAAMKAPPPKPTAKETPKTSLLPKGPSVPATVPLAVPAVRAKPPAQIPLTQQPAARGRAAQASEQQGLLARAGMAPPLARPKEELPTPLGASSVLKSGGLPAPAPRPHEVPHSFGSASSSHMAHPSAQHMAAGHMPTGLPPPARGGMGVMPVGLPHETGGLPPPGGEAQRADAPAHGLVGLPAPPSASAEESAAEGGVGCMHSLVPGGAAGSRQHEPADSATLLSDELHVLDELSLVGADLLTSHQDGIHTLHMLALSQHNMPELADSERPKTYVPRNPYPTPTSFPQTPAGVLDSPAIFDKFDTDTLFFIFYYQQGTYQQYLAARELKKQSWRYHKKYLTWFQRHEEPKVTAEEYEQGTYVYFDYETGWCQRIKSEFTFEYGYLEDELGV